MKASYWYAVLPACVYALICTPQVFASDTLLVHGHIYTGNAKMPWAEALAITGTRIDAIGTDKDLGVAERGIKTCAIFTGVRSFPESSIPTLTFCLARSLCTV